MSITLDASIGTLEALAESSVYAEDGQDLVDKVLKKIQDDSYTAEDILDRFNQCLTEIAGKMLLPDLEKWVTLTTKAGTPYIPLPADFHRNLRHCHSVTNSLPVKVYGSRQQLYRHFRIHDQGGRVIGVAPHGRQLYYQRIPESTEDLEINYWSYPERLLSRRQKPTCLPPHLVEKLLVNYASGDIFSEIEDGIEGPQVNTARYEKKYAEAFAELEAFVGPEEREPVEIEEEIDWNWCAYGE